MQVKSLRRKSVTAQTPSVTAQTPNRHKFMEAGLAELAERYECEVEEDATDVDLEEKELTEVPAVVCQLQARSTRPSRSLAL